MSHPAEHKTVSDPYYGHRDFAKLCACFLAHLFPCPNPPPPTGSPLDDPLVPLAQFIAYAQHRSRSGESTVFAALYLLQRLKCHLPAAKGTHWSTNHRLFLIALRVASRSQWQGAYWADVSGGRLQPGEVDAAERELRDFLNDYVAIDRAALKKFDKRVRRDFAGPGPYPDYTKAMYASSSSEHGPPQPSRYAAGRRAVRSSRVLGIRTEALSTIPENAPLVGIPVGHARAEKMPGPPKVPQPGLIYARALPPVW